jgi:transcriptional regulator with XRE-family HTH domain
VWCSLQAVKTPADEEQLRAFGDVVRRTRRERDLTQEDVAAAGGVHVNQVRHFERATADVRTSTLLRIIAGIGVPLSEIARRYDEAELSRPREA